MLITGTKIVTDDEKCQIGKTVEINHAWKHILFVAHTFNQCIIYLFILIRIPAGVNRFALLQNVQTGPGAHPASFTMGSGVLYRG